MWSDQAIFEGYWWFQWCNPSLERRQAKQLESKLNRHKQEASKCQTKSVNLIRQVTVNINKAVQNRCEHELCKNSEDCNDNGCKKRHPKKCRHFNDQGKCRFEGDCAYQHQEKYNPQNKQNYIVSQCMIKHEQEINAIKEEVKYLQEINKIMTEKVESLEQIIRDNSIGKHKEQMVEESFDAEVMLRCEQCTYECKI